MSFANSVTVGPRFFKKSFNDYSNKYWAFAREILQNSLDCGSTWIDIRVSESSGITLVSVQNDGEPMTEDILVNKLLSLGESGKDFKGAVGGFGKAKEILYFAHEAYRIHTGKHLVDGSGAGYDLSWAPEFPGTLSQVTWDGNHGAQLTAAFRRFIELCAPGVKFTLDGEEVRPKHAPGILNRTLDRDDAPWAEVRLSLAEPNLLVVRSGGIPMFYRRCEYKGTVAIDLLGQRLTSNRDGLIWAYTDQLSEFITSIAVDRKTAFKLEKAEYTRYRGAKLRRQVEQVPAGVAATVTPAPMGGAGIQVEALARTEAPNPLGHEFLIKNCVRKSVPAEFDPQTFGDHGKWLAKAWAGCLLELHEIFEVNQEFSVGFIFSEDVEAEYEQSTEYGRAYFLNPCRVTRKSHTRRFKKADRHRVLALAAHEFTHGLGCSYHDEDYASKLTEVMAEVLKHSRRFLTHLR